jgi:hypothetical protein
MTKERHALQAKLEKIESALCGAVQELAHLEDEARAIEDCDACGYLGRAYLALDRAIDNLLNAELVTLGGRPFAPKHPITL